MRKVSAILMGLTGWALTGAIAVSWYFTVPRYEHAMTGEDRLAVQNEYPGGSFKNIWEYWRCEERFYPNGSSEMHWIIYKANHDREVTTRGCWK